MIKSLVKPKAPAAPKLSAAQIQAKTETAGYTEIGINALRYFHNDSTIHFSDHYKISFAELQNQLCARPNQKHFLAIFGGAIANSGTNDVKVQSAMDTLATFCQGRLPDSNHAFIQALSDELTNVHLVDALGATAIETVKDIGTGFQKVGDSVIDVGGTLLDMSRWLVPLGVLAFVLIYLNREYKK